MRGILTLAGIAVLTIAATGAEADVTISNGTTENMSCSSGVCAPTAANAVLNASDLESLLESGSAIVTTTGSGVQAGNLVVADAVTWTSANALTLDAYQSITVNYPVSVDGAAGLSLATNDGGTGGALIFRDKGRVTFSSLSSVLAINGTNYTLVGDIETLASDITSDPAGNFAMAADYDASDDGVYNNAPIRTRFAGIFEGLGNKILNLSIHCVKNASVGLFAELYGNVNELGVEDATVIGSGSYLGILAGYNEGTIQRDFATGKVMIENKNDDGFAAGGLVGGNDGVIEDSYMTGSLTSITTTDGYGGGIVGFNTGEVDDSFSNVRIHGEARFYAGGLAGTNSGGNGAATIADSYAIGGVTGGSSAYVGGMIGLSTDGDRIKDSYSIGKVKAVSGYVGGFAGYNYESVYDKDYWDTTTSDSDEGVGSGAATGVRGRTTQQLQAGLPKGFSPRIWAENPKINNGLPYLIANPPPN